MALAESRFLPAMAPDLADLIREQEWFTRMTRGHLGLIETILATDRAAGPRGERDSVVEALRYASEQAWYAEGISERDALRLSGVFEAYAASLANHRAPQIGPHLGSTLHYGLMEIVELPESGSVALLTSADDEAQGYAALEMATYWLPAIEAVTGAFPYTFLHIAVTELPEIYAGLSYDEFIAIAPEWLDDETMIHELTHSTLYGIFPTWFEEGFAHFMEYYLTDRLDEAAAYFEEQLAFLGVDTRLNVGPKPGYGFEDHMADRATGFLFVKGLYEIQGTDGIVTTIRRLRTRTFTDQQLIRELVNDAPDGLEQALRAYVCDRVIGTTHNYCEPAR